MKIYSKYKDLIKKIKKDKTNLACLMVEITVVILTVALLAVILIKLKQVILTLLALAILVFIYVADKKDQLQQQQNAVSAEWEYLRVNAVDPLIAHLYMRIPSVCPINLAAASNPGQLYPTDSAIAMLPGYYIYRFPIMLTQISSFKGHIVQTHSRAYLKQLLPKIYRDYHDCKVFIDANSVYHIAIRE